MAIFGILHVAGFLRRETVDPALLLFAFTAGAAAFFAPCCVAMLPAYVAYAVRPTTAGQAVVDQAIHAPAARGATMFGLLPLSVGSVALIGQGLGTMNLFPDMLYQYLPSIDISLAFLLVGASLLILGLVLGGRIRAAIRGLTFGGLVTIGFFITFLAVGLPVALLARSLAPYLSYLSAAVGLVLVVLGVLMLYGKSINPRLPSFEADVSSPKGFFKFGMGYGVAGLSCTFPVFLAVVAAGALAGGFTAAMATFAAYAIGKAAVLVAVTVVTVAGGDGLGQKMKVHAPTIARASAWLLILAGGYMTWYFGRLIVLVGG